MKRVFTDERFPGLEVHNDGTTRFRIFQRDANGKLTEVDSFVTYSDSGGGHRWANSSVSDLEPEVADRRAKAYFNRVAKDAQEHKAGEQESGDTMQLHNGDDRDHSEIFNNSEEETGPRSPVSLDDLMGSNILTADDVLRAHDQAKAMTDPVQRERAMAQVRHMSGHLESAAEELVRRLLG